MITSTPARMRAIALVWIWPLGVCTQALAQTADAPKTGYLTDSSNGHVLAGNGVDCWHTSEWTPALALAPCDPVLKKEVLAQAPAMPDTAPKPPPEVVLAAVPLAVPVPVPQKFSYASDTLFGFDKAMLGLHARQVLDALSDQLKSARVDLIHVTGHTDRLGSTAYNQHLSERRAQVVRDYLVLGGYPLEKIDAKGMGETQPATALDACKGIQSAQLINCLRADRRVEIELRGTMPTAP